MGVCEGLCAGSDKNAKTHSNRLVGLPLVDAKGIIRKTQSVIKPKEGPQSVFVCVCKQARVQNDSSAQLPCI